MNFKLNKEQTRIVMQADALARIKNDYRIYDLIKAALYAGHGDLTDREIMEVVSVLSDKQEQYFIERENK